MKRAAGLGLFLVAACQSTGLPGLAELAAEEPLPYSVLVTGGAFIQPPPRPDDPPVESMKRTYRPTDERSEGFSLETVAAALTNGRVFVRVEEDDSPRDLRFELAGQLQPVAADDAELNEFLSRARQRGFDFILVLMRVQDGPVDYRGINGQWPITAAVWFLVGLGMVIPDHTYESRAALHVELRDVQSGRKVYDHALSGGPVNLPLLQRSTFWGVLLSIIVPPFWVADDTEGVEATIRSIASARLIFSLARQLKTVDVQTEIHGQMPATLEMSEVPGGVRVRIQAQEPLSVVRMRLDQLPLGSERFDEFELRLLQSQELRDGVLHYEAILTDELRGEHLQLLVQTVNGRVASMTCGLDQ